jgi:glycosyltransferase involved in cell wall biosynthesis
MRIAIIHPFLYREARGIERFTFNLANAWAARGDEIHLVTWRWPQPIVIDALDPAVQAHFMPTARYFTALTMGPLYAWHLARQAYDFVWLHFAGYGEAEALTLFPRQPFGVIFHFPFAQVPHRYHEFQRFNLMNRARQIVAVSQYVAEGVQAAFGRASGVIPHGVNAERFAPRPEQRGALRALFGLSGDIPVLLTVAALEERKGVQWALRALPMVLSRFPAARYWIVGDGLYRPVLEALAQELGLTAAVQWLGAQPDVAPYLQAADMFLIPARGEASSLAALEALACGLPVLAADRPPFTELITSAWGALVDETNAVEMAAIICQWLASPALRHQLGQSGRARVLAHHTWARVAEQFAQLV